MKFLGNGFEQFISGYGIWILIGVLGLAFLVAVIFLILNIYKANSLNKVNTVSEARSAIEQKEEKTEIAPVKQNDSIYSINYDDKTKEWVVKKAGASRASKRCQTEKEAKEFVEKILKK